MWLVLENSGAGKTSKCVWRQGLYVNVSSWRLTDPRLLKQPKKCIAMVLILVNLYRSISLYRVRRSVRGWWGYLCRRWALLSTAEKLEFSRFFNILYPDYSLQMLTIVLNSSQTVCETILRWWFRTRQFIKKKTFQHCASCSFKEILLTVMFTRRRRRSCCWREDHWWLGRRALVLFALQIH